MQKKLNHPQPPQPMMNPKPAVNTELEMCSEFPLPNSEKKEPPVAVMSSSREVTLTRQANKLPPSDGCLPIHDNPERLVFLGDALTDATIAEEIRSLHESKKSPLLSSSARAKIERQMYALKETHGGNFVNIEDATITQKGRRLVVRIKNCWHDETGKPYIMRVGIEDFLNFGKPFTHETRHKSTSTAGFEAYANYVRVHVKAKI